MGNIETKGIIKARDVMAQNISTQNIEFDGRNINNHFWSLDDAEAIPENADLNDYKESGNYSVKSYAVVATIKNKPSAVASIFNLKVYSSNGSLSGQYPIQEITTFDLQKLLRRYNNDSDTWTDWEEIITSGQSQNLSNKIFKNLTRFEGQGGRGHVPSIDMYVSGPNAVAFGDSPNHDETIRLGTCDRTTDEWSNLGIASLEVENEIYFKKGKTLSTELDNKLEKYSQHYVKDYSEGETGKKWRLLRVLDGSDAGYVIDISYTTSTSHHAKLIIARQNNNTMDIRIFDDVDNAIKNKLHIKSSTGNTNRVIEVYYEAYAWEKWFISVTACGSILDGQSIVEVSSIPDGLLHGTNGIPDAPLTKIEKWLASNYSLNRDATTLFTGDVGTGDLSIEHKLTNFDFVIIYSTNDDYTGMIMTLIPGWEIKWAYVMSSKYTFNLVRGSHYWNVTTASLGTTTLKTTTENCRIIMIQGVNY